MKSIFALFKKKEDTTTPEATTSNIKHSFGNFSADFLPTSRLPILLAGVLILALFYLGFQFLTQSPDVEAFHAPKGVAELNKSADAKNESIATARKQFENSQLDSSIESYRKILSKAPDDPQVLNDLGVLYLKKQEFKESEQHLARSLDKAPDCVVCLNNLGYLKTLQGKSEEAETLFKKALALNSSYVDPYFNLGVLYEKNGDFASSVTAYNEFLNRTKEPSSPFNLKLKQHVSELLEK